MIGHNSGTQYSTDSSDDLLRYPQDITAQIIDILKIFTSREKPQFPEQDLNYEVWTSIPQSTKWHLTCAAMTRRKSAPKPKRLITSTPTPSSRLWYDLRLEHTFFTLTRFSNDPLTFSIVTGLTTTLHQHTPRIHTGSHDYIVTQRNKCRIGPPSTACRRTVRLDQKGTFINKIAF